MKFLRNPLLSAFQYYNEAEQSKELYVFIELPSLPQPGPHLGAWVLRGPKRWRGHRSEASKNMCFFTTELKDGRNPKEVKWSF